MIVVTADLQSLTPSTGIDRHAIRKWQSPNIALVAFGYLSFCAHAVHVNQSGKKSSIPCDCALHLASRMSIVLYKSVCIVVVCS